MVVPRKTDDFEALSQTRYWHYQLLAFLLGKLPSTYANMIKG